MASDYRESLLVEQRGNVLLEEFLKRVSFGGRYVFTNGSRLSEIIQKRAGDVLVATSELTALCCEVKAETHWTGNFFLETWSNYPVKNGWLFESCADKLFYMFHDTLTLYTMDFRNLQLWIKDKPYRETQQKSCDQKNDTRGLIVPIRDIERERSIRMKTHKLYEDRQTEEAVIFPIPFYFVGNQAFMEFAQ